jgi:hypothetical protein
MAHALSPATVESVDGASQSLQLLPPPKGAGLGRRSRVAVLVGLTGVAAAISLGVARRSPTPPGASSAISPPASSPPAETLPPPTAVEAASARPSIAPDDERPPPGGQGNRGTAAEIGSAEHAAVALPGVRSPARGAGMAAAPVNPAPPASAASARSRIQTDAGPPAPSTDPLFRLKVL